MWLIWFEGSGCDGLLMQAASLFDGFSCDLFPPFENGLTASEVDVSRRQVVQALVVSTVVVVLDELLDALFELSWQVGSSPAGSGFSSSGDIARSCPASSGGKAGRGYV